MRGDLRVGAWRQRLLVAGVVFSIACGSSGGGKAGHGSGDGDGSTGDGDGTKLDGGGAAGDGDGTEQPKEVTDYLNALGNWGSVPASSDTPSDPKKELRDLTTPDGQKTYDCQVTSHDIVQKHDEILNFDSGSEYVKPGVLLVGDDFKHGQLSPIPLPRSPIKLSINIPKVQVPTVTVDDPNTGNIQAAVAKLQDSGQAASKNSYAAQLTFEQHSVQSVDEMAYKLGVSASFDGLFASASFSSKFEHQETTRKFTVVSRLMQQMYTITFAQDAFKNAAEFFAPSLTKAQLDGAIADGFLAKENVPVFIGSVTYGRMVVFSATSTQATSSSELEATIEAAGKTWSAKADLSMEQKKLLSTLDIQVLSIGGDQEKVTQAIKSGNWSDLYADADILNSVPLRYTVHALSGTRPIAAIGDTTKFNTADCDIVKGWYPVPGPDGVEFYDVSTNPLNSPVWALGQKSGVYAPYRLTDTETWEAVEGFQHELGDISVDSAGSVFVTDIWGANREFGNTYRLAAGSSIWAARDTQLFWMDAGDPDKLWGVSRTYGDNHDQNDLYQMSWPDSTVYRQDDSQCMKKGDVATITVAGPGVFYVWWCGNSFEYRNQDNQISYLGLSADALGHVTRISAASATELYTLNDDGQIYQFDFANKQLINALAPPDGKSFKTLEATSNSRLWAITTDGQIYSYIKPQ